MKNNREITFNNHFFTRFNQETRSITSRVHTTNDTLLCCDNIIRFHIIYRFDVILFIRFHPPQSPRNYTILNHS